mmetsp:Transcript_5764/g.13141  ORF Transcript_5764/g.13141 Transcript_5764/m.13141 type:complete len:201 (-) Transcript_5764:391-993(-)
MGTIGYFLLGEFKGITDEFGTVPNEHLHELRTGQLQKDGVGLIGARTCEESLARTGRAEEEHSLGSLDANGVEHILVRHGEDNRLDEFLNLFVAAANIGIFLGRPLVDLHGLDTRVKFGGQLFKNEVRIFVGTHEIGWLELVGINKTGNGEVNRLTSRCPNNRTARLTLSVHIGGGTLFHLFVIQPILCIRFQHLHDIPD